MSALDSANSAAKGIIGFLTTRWELSNNMSEFLPDLRSPRSGKGKIAKTTKEADYRTIFDSLVADLLSVLFWPEWPAASVLLGIVTKYLV